MSGITRFRKKEIKPSELSLYNGHLRVGFSTDYNFPQTQHMPISMSTICTRAYPYNHRSSNPFKVQLFPLYSSRRKAAWTLSHNCGSSKVI